MTAPDRLHDGGVFTAGAACPHCGTCDVHGVFKPRPWLVEERGYRHVRVCNACTYTWGQR